MSQRREDLRSRARLVAVALALGASLAGVGPASAGVGVWDPSYGPEGGSISALAVDPQRPATLYAGTEENGVFKSTDRGRRWRRLNTGLRKWVGALAIDPRKRKTVYASARPYYGVFKSTDGGRSWTAANAGRAADAADALTIDPKRPATVYAGTRPGVFKSTDGGRTWQAVNVGLPRWQVRVQALAIDPKRPATVYAGVTPDSAYGGGVFKSTDGGGTWRPFSRGLTNLSVNDLAIASTGRVLYAGTDGGGEPSPPA